MNEFHHLSTSVLTVALYVAIALLCLVGLLLSAVSISGTWLVLAAALLGRLLPPTAEPGWGMIACFLVVAILVEGAEALAGAWGVRRRGGSGLAGAAAIIGGLVGLVLGGLIPIPLLGNLLGLFIGSFAAVYAIERHRLQQADAAAHIAWGAVVSRVAVIFLKAGVTLGMVVWLAIVLVRA